MESFKNALKMGAGYIIQALGLLMFIYVWIYGAVGLYNNQRWGQEFRVLLDRTWEGEELELVSKPQPKESRR